MEMTLIKQSNSNNEFSFYRKLNNSFDQCGESRAGVGDEVKIFYYKTKRFRFLTEMGTGTKITGTPAFDYIYLFSSHTKSTKRRHVEHVSKCTAFICNNKRIKSKIFLLKGDFRKLGYNDNYFKSIFNARRKIQF